jgi:hypothetical protein
MTFYRLVLDRSGHPGRLTALPISPETEIITGLALSRDGSKLAVAVQPVNSRSSATIQVFSLASGAGREWTWPGTGTIGQIPVFVISGEMSWGADNRTLLFEHTARYGTKVITQLRLLDTAAPAGSLRAASTRVPIPSAEFGGNGGGKANHPPFQIDGTPLMTADGANFVASTDQHVAPPKILVFTLTEFSVRTGKPVQVLYRFRTDTDAYDAAVYWVNTSGSAMITARTLPVRHSTDRTAYGRTVFGVQTGTTFTPLPASVQRLLTRRGLDLRVPVW